MRGCGSLGASLLLWLDAASWNRGGGWGGGLGCCVGKGRFGVGELEVGKEVSATRGWVGLTSLKTQSGQSWVEMGGQVSWQQPVDPGFPASDSGS